MNILFLGAGKRFTLLERVIDSGCKEQIGLQLFLIEGQCVYSNREGGESYLLAAGRQMHKPRSGRLDQTRHSG